MRIGFFTDLHLKGSSVSSRKDNFPLTLIEKLEECVLHLKEHCDVGIFGGDFTDTHKISSDKIKELAILALHKLPLDFPLYYTFGQHDLNGYEYNTREDSTTEWIFRILRLLGHKVIELSPEEDEILELNGETLCLAACPASSDFQDWTKNRAAGKKKCHRVAVYHHLLSDKSDDWAVNYRQVLDLTKDSRGFDVVLSGDLHEGYGPINEDGIIFVNPGSIARNSKSKENLTRNVQGVDVILNGKNKSVEFWPLNCARPAGEVFKEDAPVIDAVTIGEIATKEKEEVSYDEAVDAIGNVEVNKLDMFELLEKTAKEKKLSKKVYAYIMTKKKDQDDLS